IAIVGTFANVINLVVFTKQGVKDNVNLSLFALAISDLLSLLLVICTCVLGHPMFIGTGVHFVGIEVEFLTTGWPHTCFTKVTSWITAFIMFERCLCIATPLKVKTVVTTARVKLCLVAIFVLVFAGVVPTYATHSLGWKFYPAYNRTLLGLIRSENAIHITYISNMLNIPVSSLSSFGVAFVCTVIITIELNKKTKWRKEAACDKGGNLKNFSRNDRRAVKMVTIVAAIFLISVTPSITILIITVFEIEFSLTGKYRSLFYVCYSITFIFEGINSSVNILVYYSMNSRY
ncbi:unnamed protein product, partial [Lymnaea stagnalis]